MDDWNFIRIGRDELVVDDERSLAVTSSGPLYFYLVDPIRDYCKIENKGEQGGAGNSHRAGQ